ncbi:MAG: sortase [Chloroflexi bacterium]|nr:sortase [Chloroflexota bacterium]
MIPFATRRFLPLLAAAALLLAVVPAASAADPMGTARRTWTATYPTNGTIGLVSYMSGMGLLRLDARNLPANRTATVAVYAGSCTSLRGLITAVERLRTAADDSLKREIRVSTYRMSKVWSIAYSGPIGMRVTASSTTRCANLIAPTATRIVISSLGIDLPVIRPPSTSSYPLCNVAEYLQARYQPGEPGGAFIYAHARVGMFLPLLTESKKASYGRLPGALVRVYTSDSKVYTYRVVEVLRHQLTVPRSTTTVGRLWLQTSEGPAGTRPKLLVVASQVSVEAASYAASHPTPRPVRCG